MRAPQDGSALPFGGRVRHVAAVSALVLLVGLASSCAVSDRDRFEYDGVDDGTAQMLYLRDQASLRKPRALKGQEWEVFVLGTTESICESLDEGVPFDEVVQFVSENLAVRDARQFVGNAAGFLCPEHLDRY